MRRRVRRKNRTRLLAWLVLLSAAALLLPARWTQPLNNLTQVLAPLEDALHTAGLRLRLAWDTLRAGPAAVLPADLENAEKRRLIHRLIALAEENRLLKEQNRELTGLRHAGLPQRGRLIPARVVRHDAAPWSDALLIDQGHATRLANVGDFVTSRLFSEITINAGQQDGLRSGMAILAGEVLIGRLERVGPYTAVVLPVWDPRSRMRVRIGRLTPAGDFRPAPGEFLLVGKGRGHMLIDEIDHRLLFDDPPAIAPGDYVITPGDDAHLPAALTIGRITRTERHPDSPLLFGRAWVEAAVHPLAIHRVYIVDALPGDP